MLGAPSGNNNNQAQQTATQEPDFDDDIPF